MNKDLTFTVNQAVQTNGNKFLISDFSGKLTNSESEQIGGEVISISQININVVQDRYLCVYFSQGNKFPYPNKVIDSKSMDEEENPRPPRFHRIK